MNKNPADATARRQLGQAYFRERQSKLALDQYREALQLEPGNENLYLESAAIILAAGLAEQVESILLEAAKRFPDSAAPSYNLLYHDLAELWANSGRLGKATEAMHRATEFEGPVAASVLYKRIGDFYSDLLRFDEAVSAYARALDLDRKNSGTRLGLGNLYLQRNNLDKAVETFSHLIKEEPGSTEALYGIAEAQRRMGRLGEAVETAASILKLEPAHAGALYIRGSALVRLGKDQEGQMHLEEYARLQAKARAENHRLREIQTCKTTGMFRLLEGQYDEAIAIFKEGIAAYADVAELYVNLGLAQSQAGRHRDAIETFLNLLSRKLATDTLIHRYLAREYLSIGDVEAGKRHDAIYAQKREVQLGAASPN